jgi:RecA-family ATPase
MRPDRLACEAITEVDGKAKSAGKTTFALAMCKAILAGTEFLGKQTRRSAIVYLTEESTPSFRAALERSGIGSDSDFHILPWGRMIQSKDEADSGSCWAQAVDAAIAKAKEVRAQVLAVDTFAQFAHLIGDKENSAGDILEAVEACHQSSEKLARNPTTSTMSAENGDPLNSHRRVLQLVTDSPTLRQRT